MNQCLAVDTYFPKDTWIVYYMKNTTLKTKNDIDMHIVALSKIIMNSEYSTTHAKAAMRNAQSEYGRVARAERKVKKKKAKPRTRSATNQTAYDAQVALYKLHDIPIK